MGDIAVFAEGDAIGSLDWGWVPKQTPSPILEKAREEFHAYFDGELTKFNLKLALAGTAYQRVVWQTLCDIPYGKASTYQDIMRKSGGSARSVGQANGRNPIPLIIPCHRVVAVSHIGGYSGGDGLVTKRWLLTLENPNRTLL